MELIGTLEAFFLLLTSSAVTKIFKVAGRHDVNKHLEKIKLSDEDKPSE